MKVYETTDVPPYLYDGPWQGDENILSIYTQSLKPLAPVPQHFAEAIQCLKVTTKDVKERHD